MSGFVIFDPGFLLLEMVMPVAGFYETGSFPAGKHKGKGDAQYEAEGNKEHSDWSSQSGMFGLHIVKKFIDQLQLQFLLVCFIIGEQLPETVKKVADCDKIQFRLVSVKKSQLLHLFLHKNDRVLYMKGGWGEMAEKSYVLAVIIEAMVQITDGAGLHCQKICHRKILETDSLREVKSIKQVSVNKFDPGVGGDRRKLVRLICYAEILVIAGILVFGAFAVVSESTL